MNTCEKCGHVGDDVRLDIEFGKMECDACYYADDVAVFYPLPSYGDFVDDLSWFGVPLYRPMVATVAGRVFRLSLRINTGEAVFTMTYGDTPANGVIDSSAPMGRSLLDALLGSGWRVLLSEYRHDSLDMLNTEYVS